MAQVGKASPQVALYEGGMVSQCLVEVGDRPLKVTLISASNPTIVVGQDIFGIEFNGLVKVGDRPFNIF